MKRILGSLIVATLLVATTAQAKDRDFGEIYIECGLGGMIGSGVKGQTGDILAIITNVTWDLGTTAFSSDITSDSTCANSKALTASLINEGYNTLEEEIAVGKGEYLDALQKVSPKVDIEILREEFLSLATTEEYSRLSHFEKSEKLFNIVTK